MLTLMLKYTTTTPNSRNAGPLDKLESMVALSMPYTVEAVGMSDIGLVRQNNEDVWAEVPEIGLFVLADGMGGHQAGEVAARETVTRICRALKRKIARSKRYSLQELQDLLRRAIKYVNGQVYKLSRSRDDLRGMGTTLCSLLFHADGVALGHVGDSRVYRFRCGSLEQLTKDHSLLRELVDQGQLSDQQATDFLYKNIITKAIGTEGRVEPAIEALKVHEGDIFLMCTDGLSDLLLPDEIEAILSESESIDAAAGTLIGTANAMGGRDNITVVIVQIRKKDAHKDLSR